MNANSKGNVLAAPSLWNERMSCMRDFSWRYFESTGEIDAYLLYKEHQYIVGDTRKHDAESTLESEGDIGTE